VVAAVVVVTVPLLLSRLACLTPGPGRKPTGNRLPFGGSPKHFSSIVPKPFALLKPSPSLVFRYLLFSAIYLAMNCTLNSTGAPWIFTQEGSDTHRRDLEFTIWFSCALKTLGVVPDSASSDIWTLLLLNCGQISTANICLNVGISLEACCGTSVNVHRSRGGGINAASNAAFLLGKSR